MTPTAIEGRRRCIGAAAVWLGFLGSSPVVVQDRATRALRPDTADWALATLADCEAPDGSTFTTEVVSLPDGRLRFVQVLASGRTEMLIADAASAGATEPDVAALSRDPGTGDWNEATEGTVSFLRGHDVHRLFLDALAVATDGEGPERVTRLAPPTFGGGEVQIDFGDARDVAGVDLPTAVEFRHAGEVYRYRFRHLLPLRLAPGTTLPDEPQALFDRLGDLHALAASHERVMQAHRDGDVEALVAEQNERGIQSGRGVLREVTREDTRGRLGPYLASSEFERYADVVAPVVAVSTDGSLGWVACQMEARGVQRSDEGDERMDFGYTWVELYARTGGRWVRTGNASSERSR